MSGHVFETPVAEIPHNELSLMQGKRLMGLPEGFDDLYCAVDGKKIEPTVVVVVDPSSAKAGVWERDRLEPGWRSAILEYAGSVIDVEVGSFTRQLGHDEILVAVVVEVGRVDAHAAFGFSANRQSHTREQRNVLECAVALVQPQLVFGTIIRHVDVHPSVAVEVSCADAQGRTELGANARLGSNIGKSPIAPVSKKLAGKRLVGLWRAIAERAERAVARSVARQVVSEIVADIQVEPAVTIDVHESSRHTPADTVGTAHLRDVAERAVTIVAEHLIAAEIRQIQIDAAVVVEVAGCDAHPVVARDDSALIGHVREMQLTCSVGTNLQVIAVQPAFA